MSKSILIVICDFLLLSLLSLARFDQDPTADPSQRAAQVSDPSGARQDLVEVMSFALAQEKQAREQLSAQLNQAQEALQNRDVALQEKEKAISQALANLRAKNEEVQQLDQTRSALQQQIVSTEGEMQQLQKRLQSTRDQAVGSQARVAALEAELKVRQETAAQMNQQIVQLEQTRQRLESEKDSLAGNLKAAETERSLVREQLGEVRQEVATVREEKTALQEHAQKLAAGVNTLAEKSGELAKEIQDFRPLAANTIFNEFTANRVQAHFEAVRNGFFGQTVRRTKDPRSVLVSDGKQTYALFHIEDTPLNFGEAGTDWEYLNGSIRKGFLTYPIERVSFLASDPRVVLVPVSETEARRFGAKVYSLSAQPFRFPDAVLVGADEGYYGELKFQLNPNMPGYVKVENRLMNHLTGKFTPSRGDLVFSQSGELLGIMINDDYCALLDQLRPSLTVSFGAAMQGTRTGSIISRLNDWKNSLPQPLQ